MRTLWAKWLKVAPWLAGFALLALLALSLQAAPLTWLVNTLYVLLVPSVLTVFYLNDRSYREGLYLRGYNDGKAEKTDDQGNS
jgi:uncharacterized membrane protein SirB2